MHKDEIHNAHKGKWCLLLDTRCRGMLAIAVENTRLGMRMNGVGIVPHDEYRLATEEEITIWLDR